VKHLVLCAGLAVLVAGAALAEKPAKPEAAKTEVPCAVMKNHKVNIKDATAKKAFSDYKGRRYFFCCAGCKPDFAKNPAKYAKAENSIPTPKK
jgi:YHS domain-containing protein